MTDFKELIEKYRKKECFCNEIPPEDVCEKCGQDIEPIIHPCFVCRILNDLLKLSQSDETQNNSQRKELYKNRGCIGIKQLGHDTSPSDTSYLDEEKKKWRK